MGDGHTRFETIREIHIRYRYLGLTLPQIRAMVDHAHNKGIYQGKNFSILRKGNTELFFIR